MGTEPSHLLKTDLVSYILRPITMRDLRKFDKTIGMSAGEILAAVNKELKRRLNVVMGD